MKYVQLFFAVVILLTCVPAFAADTHDSLQSEKPRAGKMFKDCPDCPEMVPIPGKNYAIGKYEVTQGEWKALMGNNPSYFTNCGDNCPVEDVSWDQVQAFIQKLNAKTDKQYRLPTETEWEYACYGGNQTEYCGGNDPNAVGWTDANSSDQTHPVGQKQANGYGLYDMSGNVSEWMNDCETETETGLQTCVVRGGSWRFKPEYSRAARRSRDVPAFQFVYGGFRLVRMLP